jgi:hypothetical protein
MRIVTLGGSRGGHGDPPVVRPKGALDRGVKVPSRYALSDL